MVTVTNKKGLWMLVLSLVMCVGFVSCNDDDDYNLGYDLSGAYGKTWYGDFGKFDGDMPLFSEISFYAGSTYNHGTGTEQRYWQGYHFDHPFGRLMRFDWEIEDGIIYLYYDDGSMEYIYDYYIRPDLFKGYFGSDDYPFEMYLEYRW